MTEPLRGTSEQERTYIAVELGKIHEQMSGMKEDVTEIRVQTKLTNGRVTGLEKGQAAIKGGLALITCLTPFALFVLAQLH